MSIWEIVLLAVALSMDAFAVAVCKGLAMKKISFKEAGVVGLWFGGFQALMPAIGFLLASSFSDLITSIDHWIGFILLTIIGINMIKEALSKCDECVDASLAFGKMFAMAVATSIDALAVGVTFAFRIHSCRELGLAVGLIGICTFMLSAIGVKIGNVFGIKFKSKAEIFGGVILILLGVNMLFDAESRTELFHMFGMLFSEEAFDIYAEAFRKFTSPEFLEQIKEPVGQIIKGILSLFS